MKAGDEMRGDGGEDGGRRQSAATRTLLAAGFESGQLAVFELHVGAGAGAVSVSGAGTDLGLVGAAAGRVRVSLLAMLRVGHEPVLSLACAPLWVEASSKRRLQFLLGSAGCNITFVELRKSKSKSQSKSQSSSKSKGGSKWKGAKGLGPERTQRYSLVERKRCTLAHAGVSHARVRGDGAVAATAGWDQRLRIFHWHQRRQTEGHLM